MSIPVISIFPQPQWMYVHPSHKCPPLSSLLPTVCQWMYVHSSHKCAPLSFLLPTVCQRMYVHFTHKGAPLHYCHSFFQQCAIAKFSFFLPTARQRMYIFIPNHNTLISTYCPFLKQHDNICSLGSRATVCHRILVILLLKCESIDSCLFLLQRFANWCFFLLQQCINTCLSILLPFLIGGPMKTKSSIPMVHQLIYVHSFQRRADSCFFSQQYPNEYLFIPSEVCALNGQPMDDFQISAQRDSNGVLLNPHMDASMDVYSGELHFSGLWSRNQVGKAHRNWNRVWRPDVSKYNRNRTFSNRSRN